MKWMLEDCDSSSAMLICMNIIKIEKSTEFSFSPNTCLLIWGYSTKECPQLGNVILYITSEPRALVGGQVSKEWARLLLVIGHWTGLDSGHAKWTVRPLALTYCIFLVYLVHWWVARSARNRQISGRLFLVIGHWTGLDSGHATWTVRPLALTYCIYLVYLVLWWVAWPARNGQISGRLFFGYWTLDWTGQWTCHLDCQAIGHDILYIPCVLVGCQVSGHVRLVAGTH